MDVACNGIAVDCPDGRRSNFSGCLRAGKADSGNDDCGYNSWRVKLKCVLYRNTKQIRANLTYVKLALIMKT